MALIEGTDDDVICVPAPRDRTAFHMIDAGAGDDTLTGDGPESLLGGADRLWGDSGDDSLDGGSGGDYLDGGDDTDTCVGGVIAARCES